jgi:phosphoserine phosphatase RsbU/P
MLPQSVAMNPATFYRNAELTAPSAELRAAFAEMRREMEIMRRREEIREAEISRLSAELDEAGRLQRQLVTGPLPEIRGGELSAFTHPADRISGDFHLVRRVSTNRVALVVGDATGHGVAAGLLSATVMGSVHANDEAEDSSLHDPAVELARLNRNLIGYSLDDCEFVTAIYAEYDETARIFRWSRAGAPPPILLRRGEKARRLESPGLPLGVEAEAAYTCAEVRLEPGDMALLHTDGLEALHTQCTGSREEPDFLRWIEQLNERNLESSLREVADRHPRTGQASDERDDMTLLVLRIIH